jgi:selenide,water dikinase
MNYKLTQYSHGAGCGCKISPKILHDILQTQQTWTHYPQLLVGNQSKDDAAVFDLGNGQAIISTTDFFMPIVDSAFDFGQIASVNAISDIYAMGGKPLMAIAILGWTIDKLPPELAQELLEGSRTVCQKAGIPLAGGHSIDSPEPIFGLAVTGMVPIENLKRNDTATIGCKLFLTKPLGVGILTTAQKRGIVKEEDYQLAIDSMLRLNDLGEKLGKLPYIKALTDVTGFGLLGHLAEMCEGSEVSAEINFRQVPQFSILEDYITQKSIPGGTNRNWDSYGHLISPITSEQRAILADPQTSGGLLVAVEADYEADFLRFAQGEGYDLASFGYLKAKGAYLIEVKG